MSKTPLSTDRRLLLVALVMGFIAASAATMLPQQQARLQGNVLTDSMSRAVSAVKNALGFEQAFPSRSGDAGDALPPFMLHMIGQEAGWTCANCTGALPSDASRLSGGDVRLACAGVGMPCTEDGVGTDGYPLDCEDFRCVYDDDAGGEFGWTCGVDDPCEEPWDCYLPEHVCMDRDS